MNIQRITVVTFVNDLSVWQGTEIAAHPTNLRLWITKGVASQSHFIPDVSKLNLEEMSSKIDLKMDLKIDSKMKMLSEGVRRKRSTMI